MTPTPIPGGGPTEAQKSLFLEEHFRYEVQEHYASVWISMSIQRHAGLASHQVELLLSNTALDHFLLHARNLLEFYYEERKPHLYARAREFVPSWRPPKKTPWIRRLEKKVHGEVTHLAWERLSVPPSEKGWPFVQIGADLLDVTENFLASLDMKYHTKPIRELRAEASIFRERFEMMMRLKRQVLPDIFEGF